MKVFVSNIDSPLGHNLSRILSMTVVGSRLNGGAAEPVEEEETPPTSSEGETPVEPKEKKECYTCIGSYMSELPAALRGGVRQTPAKPGRMVETGDRKRDAAKLEAIDKIPTRGTRAKWVNDAQPVSSSTLDMMLSSDIIIFDGSENVDEAAAHIAGMIKNNFLSNCLQN